MVITAPVTDGVFIDDSAFFVRYCQSQKNIAIR